MENSKAFKAITESEKFQCTKNYIQHGTVSIYDHSIYVANTSIKLSKKLHIKVNEESLIKTSLLHDYFLYDWHDKNHPRLHGFRHAKIAADNAMRDFGLTEKEYKIISSHMFPLGYRIPSSREALILTISDKYCASRETLRDAPRKLKKLAKKIKL